MVAPPLPRLAEGDQVMVIGPGPTTVETLAGWGLDVHIGEWAGDDERRLASLNGALRDPTVRAVIVDAGLEPGAEDCMYRIADQVDAEAVRRDPKPVVGIGDTTHLHLVLWRHCGMVGVHGTVGESLRQVLMVAEPVRLSTRPDEITAAVSVPGRAEGFLIGGSMAAIRDRVGAGLPDLAGAILLLEDPRTIGLGQVDRQLTQLLRSGSLHGVRGVAVGRIAGFDGFVDRGWTLVDVLRDRLGTLGVPVLGGLPLGQAVGSLAVPLGPMAVLDADAGTLVVDPAVY